MASSESKVNGSTGLSAKELIGAMSDDDKKALKGWYFFDWANQAYALTVMTVIAPALMASLYPDLFNDICCHNSTCFGSYC